MASSITISPSVGNAPFPTQGGVGASPGFDAIDFRRFWSRQYTEGVTTATDWRVTEAAGGPSLVLDVAAQLGPAFVQGDYVTDQGIYYVAPHSGVASLDVPAPDATNPRVDRVVLRVYDNEHDGSGLTTSKVEIVAGTPTSGATLSNAAGIAVLPNSALHLATVLVPAAATTIPNANIRDFRTYGLRDARVGDYKMVSHGTPGPGWLLADGSTVRRDQFASLLAQIGSTYGAGDGTTTFQLPDLMGRSPMGAGTGSGLTGRTLGQKAGAETHQLTEAEMPSHTHNYDDASNRQGGITVGNDDVAFFYPDAQKASAAKGGNGSHPNVHPVTIVQFAIFTGSVAVPS